MEIWLFSCSFFGLLVNSFAIGLTSFFKLLICEEKTCIFCIKMSLNILSYLNFFTFSVYCIFIYLCNLVLFVLILFLFFLIFGFLKKKLFHCMSFCFLCFYQCCFYLSLCTIKCYCMCNENSKLYK